MHELVTALGILVALASSCANSWIGIKLARRVIKLEAAMRDLNLGLDI